MGTHGAGWWWICRVDGRLRHDEDEWRERSVDDPELGSFDEWDEDNRVLSPSNLANSCGKELHRNVLCDGNAVWAEVATMGREPPTSSRSVLRRRQRTILPRQGKSKKTSSCWQGWTKNTSKGWWSEGQGTDWDSHPRQAPKGRDVMWVEHEGPQRSRDSHQ